MIKKCYCYIKKYVSYPWDNILICLGISQALIIPHAEVFCGYYLISIIFKAYSS